MKRIITISLFLFCTGIVQLFAQDADRLIQKGNELYKEQKYREAELVYNEVLEKEPSNNTAKY
ncbi:MAG TPA: hypothetical protein VJU78_01760, partial [Chitinophagaceae bacterium]|nr:hypothetical protein [Chitinophagaceae bacterium]